MRRWMIAALAGFWWIAPAQAQATFTPREESPEEFVAGPGRDETFYACTACHGFKLVAQQGLSRARGPPTRVLTRKEYATGGAGRSVRTGGPVSC